MIFVDHFKEDYSLIMGLVDLIPVILFGVAGSFIIKELFSKLKKPFAVMMCSGVTLSLTAGVFKAIWKILLSLGVCDLYPFDAMFMPTQSLGFVLMGVGLLSIMWTLKDKKAAVSNVIALPVIFLFFIDPVKQESGSIVFIILLVVGELMIATSLCYLSVRNKKWLALVLFVISCIALITMGAMKPLSTKLNMTETVANWVEESINIVAQGTLLGGVLILNKKGFLAFKENR